MTENECNSEIAINSELLNICYHVILNRPPENERMISVSPNDVSIETIRDRFINCREFTENYGADLTLRSVASFVQNAAHPTSRFAIVQTSDPLKYRDMLLTSARFNSIYASEHQWEYQCTIGIRWGVHPHHATYNRIYILCDMIDSGFDGWVLYLDADNIIHDRKYDLKSKLRELEAQGQCFYFFNHNEVDHPKFRWGDLNAGLFAVNLRHPVAIEVIRGWRRFYEQTYPKAELASKTTWGSMINDQDSLRRIIESSHKLINMDKYICWGSLQNCFAWWFGRTVENPDENDVNGRLRRLVAAGKQVYGELP
jgi:hypothetical protein